MLTAQPATGPVHNLTALSHAIALTWSSRVSILTPDVGPVAALPRKLQLMSSWFAAGWRVS